MFRPTCLRGLLAGAALLVAFSPQAAEATLVGDVVRVTRGAYIGDPPVIFWDFTFVVTDSGSDTVNLSGLGNNTFVNVQADSILISHPNGGGCGCSESEISVVVIEDLDWVGNPDGVITGISYDTDLPGFDESLISFGDHRVEIRYGTLAWTGGQHLHIFLETSDVPEPSAAALVGFGLLGIAARRRRR